VSDENGGHRWSKFWWADWQNDEQLRMCSMAAQGVWMRALCTMHNAGGYLLVDNSPVNGRSLARIWGAEKKQIDRCLAELLDKGVASITNEGVIFSRRMVRDFKASAAGAEAAAKRHHPNRPNGSPNGSPNAKPNGSPNAPEARSLEARKEPPVGPHRAGDLSPPSGDPLRRRDGTNPRALGSNPRVLGTNPRVVRPVQWRNGAFAVILAEAAQRHDDDEPAIIGLGHVAD